MFQGGAFATLYLAPFNYHRIHMPLPGTLRAAWYVPGKLFSVNATTAASVAGLFARNERVVCVFEDGPLCYRDGAGGRAVRRQHGDGVAWGDHAAPAAAPRGAAGGHGRRAGLAAEGAEMGRFNMGSTVILLLPPGRSEWLPELAARGCRARRPDAGAAAHEPGRGLAADRLARAPRARARHCWRARATSSPRAACSRSTRRWS